jgi:hypothetical protein
MQHSPQRMQWVRAFTIPLSDLDQNEQNLLTAKTRKKKNMK